MCKICKTKKAKNPGVLIIVVLIGLVILFKNQLTSLVKNILEKITSQSKSV